MERLGAEWHRMEAPTDAHGPQWSGMDRHRHNGKKKLNLLEQ